MSDEHNEQPSPVPASGDPFGTVPSPRSTSAGTSGPDPSPRPATDLNPKHDPGHPPSGPEPDPVATSSEPAPAPATPTQWAPPEPSPTSWTGPQQRPETPRRRRRTTNIVLFALTVMTTTYWGFIQYQSFYLDQFRDLVLNPFAAPHLFVAGLPYGLAVIAFLLSHEMGHYLACRYYGIEATLPYFIPIPPIPPFVLLPGTMGAVIRIMSPLKTRRALFDVAIAGPLAGFLVALPILAVGLGQSRVVSQADMGPSIQMGEPLIWGPLQHAFAPPVGAGETLLAHPLAFVGWFALLVTAMNLLPIGQLDGGHLLYTVLPRHHRKVSILLVAFMFYAGFRYFTGWFVFGAIVLFVLGTRHPRPMVFEESLGGLRVALLVVALLIFVTSFMLVPVTIDF